MRRPNFFYWYYSQGVWELLEIWKNFLFFAWKHFSIFELFKTLFYPWHRDVSVQNWRGLHPFRMFELIFGNVISCFIGAVVRIAVIYFGLVVFLVVLIFGIVINFIWISAPLVIIFLFIYIIKGLINPPLAGGFILGWIVFSIYCYFYDTKVPVIKIGFDEFLKHKMFERICERFGIISKRFPKEILNDEKLLNDFLKMRGLTPKDYQHIVQWELLNEQRKDDSKKFWRWENLKKIRPIGMQWRYGYTIKLDSYCKDLSEGDWSEYAKAELVGRNNEYEILKMVLQRPDQNCVLVVGNSGIGKKTLIHSLARNIRLKEEKGFENVRILLLDLGRAISEAINKGEDVENFLRMLFHEASYAGNIILVIEHLEQFLGKEANTFHPDISAVLTEFLNVPTFQIIATSTTKEYHQLIEKQDQIVKYFEIIEMREPSENETVTILLSNLEKYENKRILFTFKALKEIVLGSGKYNQEFSLPKRALDLAMNTLMFWEKKSNEQFISEKIVADYLTSKSKILL